MIASIKPSRASVFSIDQITLRSGSIGGATSSLRDNPRELFVSLPGVASAQNITIELSNFRDARGGVVAASVPLSVGLLTGDTNGDRAVNSGDATQTRNRSGQTINATNFRSDVNLDGAINSADATVIRTNFGTAIPTGAPAPPSSRQQLAQ
ncbi:MAG: dockerin type I domain-containing protein [Verrucomicrobiota bacterium]|nr:dockerin type I domain-containing protein [Verrucomicrobiota bacterium]